MTADDASPPPLPNDEEPRSPNEVDRPRIIRSDELLQGSREVWIEHGAEMYRLRVTAAGKLYLTK